MSTTGFPTEIVFTLIQPNGDWHNAFERSDEFLKNKKDHA